MKPLEIHTDFECANATNLRRISDTEFELAPIPDRCTNVSAHAVSDYNVAFRIANPDSTAQQATVHLHTGTRRTVAYRKVRDDGTVGVEDWHPLPDTRVSTDPDREIVRIGIEVPARGTLDVASMYWMSATQVMDRLAEIGAAHGEIEIASLGATHEGREIPAVDLSARGPKNAPLRVVSATPQSSELGTIAVMGLLEGILRGELENVIGTSRLILLPLTNPDCTAHGMCMSNAVHQNVIFGFGDLGTNKAPMECTAVWDYLMDLHPEFFLEFHSYPHLNRPSFRPYVFDLELFSDQASRERGAAFFSAVTRISPSPPYTVNKGSVDERNFAPSLVQKLIREHGIPATIYKLHNRETVSDNLSQAARVVEEVVRSMNRHERMLSVGNTESRIGHGRKRS